MKRKKEKQIISDLQLEKVDVWLSRWLGACLALVIVMHNLFFLGFFMAILAIMMGHWIFPMVYKKRSKKYIDNLFKYFGFVLLSSVGFQFILHNAFSFGYQVNCLISLVGFWIIIKIYKTKKT